MVNRIALFRFHEVDNIADLVGRVEFFKELNPAVGVYGLFGGSMSDFSTISTEVRSMFKTLTFWSERDATIKWKCADLAYLCWFNQVGRHLVFDVLHSFEWDILFMDSLDNLYSRVPIDTLGCSGLIPAYALTSWYWVADPTMKIEWDRLLTFVRHNYNYGFRPLVIQGPGLCMPRRFLEKMGNIRLPLLCNDEVRIPLLAQLTGIDMVENGFFLWDDLENRKIFNCNKVGIEVNTIQREMRKQNGFRVFHPYLQPFDSDAFRAILSNGQRIDKS